MVRGRLRSFVNVAQLSAKAVPSNRASRVELSMLVRVALVRVITVSACVLGAGLFGAGIFGASTARAEELAPEQARAFVIGKLFSYTCFEGTVGQGRIFPDGSVIGTIRMRGTGETRFAALPAGTIRVDGTSMCAHLPGLPITPCFRVQKIDYRSFRGSVSGMGFAYCDFYQRNPRSQLINSPAEAPAATPIPTRPTLRPSLDE
jgi:hypothetical protein